MDPGDGGGTKQGEGGGKRDIRRPMNAFLIFCKRHRSMVREKHPDRDNRSVTRILGDLWANLAEDEKSIYTNLAKQYKDAFMKANPDYKWHSSEKLPQPVKMSTRPTNARASQSVSKLEHPLHGSTLGSLADHSTIGGLGLLLMAGQHTFPPRENHTVPMPVLERRMTSPDLTSSNSALLQLAEMCSTELRSTQAEDAVLRSAPPKKRARHWSYSEFGHAVVSNKTVVNQSDSFTCWPLSNITPSVQSTSAGNLGSESDRPSLQRNDDKGNKKVLDGFSVILKHDDEDGRKQLLSSQTQLDSKLCEKADANFWTSFKPSQPNSPLQDKKDVSLLMDVHDKKDKNLLEGSLLFESSPDIPEISKQSHRAVSVIKEIKNTQANQKFESQFCKSNLKTSSYEVAMPPKKKFMKLQETYRTDEASLEKASGSLSDQNDNAIITCGKLMVDHIIDRLYTANNGPFSDRASAPVDIEQEKTVVDGISASQDVSHHPGEVTHKPQNLVEKVIEEAYSMDGNTLTKLKSPMKAVEEELVQTDLNQTSGSSNESKASIDMEGGLEIATKKGPEESEHEQVQQSVCRKEEMGDLLQDEDGNFSLQPLRKSRRRNRGKRYQELINEGIIQPSKERLAARRMEQKNPGYGISSHYDERRLDDDAERQLQGVKRSASESECSTSEESRYRTGDFDLEAEIATLPPCSLEQMNRRRLARKHSDSESSKKGGTCPSPTKEDNPVLSPPPVRLKVQLFTQRSEPLTGSQKRKARKHSISHLVPGSSGKGSNSSLIPLVRDATTVTAVEEERLPNTTASTSLTTTSVTCMTSVSPSDLSSQDDAVSPLPCQTSVAADSPLKISCQTPVVANSPVRDLFYNHAIADLSLTVPNQTQHVADSLQSVPCLTPVAAKSLLSVPFQTPVVAESLRSVSCRTPMDANSPSHMPSESILEKTMKETISSDEKEMCCDSVKKDLERRRETVLLCNSFEKVPVGSSLCDANFVEALEDAGCKDKLDMYSSQVNVGGDKKQPCLNMQIKRTGDVDKLCKGNETPNKCDKPDCDFAMGSYSLSNGVHAGKGDVEGGFIQNEERKQHNLTNDKVIIGLAFGGNCQSRKTDQHCVDRVTNFSNVYENVFYSNLKQPLFESENKNVPSPEDVRDKSVNSNSLQYVVYANFHEKIPKIGDRGKDHENSSPQSHDDYKQSKSDYFPTRVLDFETCGGTAFKTLSHESEATIFTADHIKVHSSDSKFDSEDSGQDHASHSHALSSATALDSQDNGKHCASCVSKVFSSTFPSDEPDHEDLNFLRKENVTLSKSMHPCKLISESTVHISDSNFSDSPHSVPLAVESLDKISCTSVESFLENLDPGTRGHVSAADLLSEKSNHLEIASEVLHTGFVGFPADPLVSVEYRVPDLLQVVSTSSSDSVINSSYTATTSVQFSPLTSSSPCIASVSSSSLSLEAISDTETLDGAVSGQFGCPRSLSGSPSVAVVHS